MIVFDLRLFILALVLALVAACGSDKVTQETKEEATTSSSPPVIEEFNMPQSNIEPVEENYDWVGEYEGVLPCDDCEGLYTNIILEPDGKTTLQRVYVGKEDEGYIAKSRLRWYEKYNLLYIREWDESFTKFYVGDGIMIQLDDNWNKRTGPDANQYNLRKVDRSDEF